MSPESGAAFQSIYLAMYDTPMALNNKFEVVPWAAEKWEQRNPTTWRLTIRRDLTFSNGDKLTAADVAFTA
jgi:peptide/nickel transport system substrate-binding protein